jgi:hypothetical protein
MNKSEVPITEQEYRNLAGKSGLVHIPSQDRIINTNSITEVVSEDSVKQERNRNNEGVLHDGLPVVRQFGRWYANDGNIDEQGKLQTMVDPTYYLEVARDQVPSPKEFQEKYEHLSREERLKLMVGDRKSLRSGEGLKKLTN